MKRITCLLCAVLYTSALLPARQAPTVCGTHSETWREELYLHRQSLRRLSAEAKATVRSAAPATARDFGNIAVLDDADGVVSRPNEFDLIGRTVQFEPVAAGASRYRFTVGAGSYDTEAANATTRPSLDDDDYVNVTLPFAFPFFGTSYQTVFINSDGNLTFNSGDASISERSLGRLAAGPPRIAPLFRDLDPSRANQGIRVFAAPDRFVVTWVAVPEYSFLGLGRAHTFQVRLYPNGRIDFSYQTVPSGSAVVGIAPGALRGPTSVVSFSDGSSVEYSAAIAESFGSQTQVDTVRAAQRFYETHDDSYDYLVFYNALDIPARDGAVAFEVTVRNNRTGYGDFLIDIGSEYGSKRRLQAVINMGPLSQYPVDPRARVPARGRTGDTPLSVLGHEVGHLFLAFASIRNPNNPNARPMLDTSNAHWNFNFNSDASLLEGNRIVDHGAGANPRFETVATVEGFSHLDQYLMGLRAPDEVAQEMFLVQNSTAIGGLPAVGVTFNGERRDIRIDEIIAAEGRRTPDHTVSQRRFRVAFVLITAAGVDPTPQQIEQVEGYRRAFEEYFREVTSGRAEVDTRLARALQLSTFPAAGVLAGSTVQGSITLDQPAAAPVTVTLSSSNASVEVPASVVIPAGQSRATFEVRGAVPGIADIVAASGDDFERVVSKIQVRETASQLRVAVVSGDLQLAVPGQPLPQPVVLMAVDENNVPYANQRIVVNVSPGGSVQPASAITDERGIAEFRWTPGANPLNELSASVEGSSAAPLTATALGPPAIADSAIVNAASYQPGITPGGLGRIFGANLAAGARVAAGMNWANSLAGVVVRINGTPTPLLFVSDRQINFWTPSNLPPGTAQVQVVTPLGISPPQQVEVSAVHPGIFFDALSGAGAVLVAGTAQTTAERPVEPGGFIEIYCTGLGRTNQDSALATTISTPEVTINGQPAEVLFSGLAPGFLGLYQVNVRVPEGTASGEATLAITMEGRRSNEVKIRVR